MRCLCFELRSYEWWEERGLLRSPETVTRPSTAPGLTREWFRRVGEGGVGYREPDAPKLLSACDHRRALEQVQSDLNYGPVWQVCQERALCPPIEGPHRRAAPDLKIRLAARNALDGPVAREPDVPAEDEAPLVLRGEFSRSRLDARLVGRARHHVGGAKSERRGHAARRTDAPRGADSNGAREAMGRLELGPQLEERGEQRREWPVVGVTSGIRFDGNVSREGHVGREGRLALGKEASLHERAHDLRGCRRHEEPSRLGSRELGEEVVGSPDGPVGRQRQPG